MPAKSKTQKQLMAWSYACKTGKAEDCPEKPTKIGKQMTKKQLRKFFEGIVYNTKKSNQNLLTIFLNWLDSKHVKYLYSDNSGELEIYNEVELSRDDDKTMLQYIAKLGLEKIWETGGLPAEPGLNLANLNNVNGQNSVRLAPSSSKEISDDSLKVSGDRFDMFDDDDEDNEVINKKRARKKKLREEKIKRDLKRNIDKQIGKNENIMSFNDFCHYVDYEEDF